MDIDVIQKMKIQSDDVSENDDDDDDDDDNNDDENNHDLGDYNRDDRMWLLMWYLYMMISIYAHYLYMRI